MSTIIDISCSRRVPDSAALNPGDGCRYVEQFQMQQEDYMRDIVIFAAEAQQVEVRLEDGSGIRKFRIVRQAGKSA